MPRIKKLTPSMLRRLVLEEKARMQEVLETGLEDSEKVADDADEVDADKQADTLAKDIDYVKALQIKERALRKQLKRITEAKKKLRTRIVRKLS